MREYGQIQCSFWAHPDIVGLSSDAKLLACYLLTGPHSNGIGCYRLPDGYVTADFEWPSKRVREGFAELSTKGFIRRCESTYFVLIPKFLAWNPISNPNVAKARYEEFKQIPKTTSVYNDLCEAMETHGNHWPNGFERVTPTSPEQNPTQPRPNPDPEPTQTQPTLTRRKASASTEKPPEKTAGSEVWQAYSNAYRDRYGHEPPRNAKSNSLCKQLVDRLGAEDAPQVAAWYVGHSNGWYVQKGHSLPPLIQDAESLLTQWRNGNQITAAAAREVDGQAKRGQVWDRLLAEAD